MTVTFLRRADAKTPYFAMKSGVSRLLAIK
jgi:hypothetical protein